MRQGQLVLLLGRDRRRIADCCGYFLLKAKGTSIIHGRMALDVLKFDSKLPVVGVDSGATLRN